MNGQDTPKRGQHAHENVAYEDSSEQPSTEDLASGPAERAILGDQGPWGFLGLVAAIVLFIVIAGVGFFFANA